nr:hypothetical protein [Mucilaginibacter sp. SP1R1]
MTAEYLKKIKSEIEALESNTSWTKYTFEEVEKLNEKVQHIERLLEKNNLLLSQLIQIMNKE